MVIISSPLFKAAVNLLNGTVKAKDSKNQKEKLFGWGKSITVGLRVEHFGML